MADEIEAMPENGLQGAPNHFLRASGCLRPELKSLVGAVGPGEPEREQPQELADQMGQVGVLEDEGLALWAEIKRDALRLKPLDPALSR